MVVYLRVWTDFCKIQFILALENICNRLLVVPKPARVSALRAELTGLNHLLPAEVSVNLCLLHNLLIWFLGVYANVVHIDGQTRVRIRCS